MDNLGEGSRIVRYMGDIHHTPNIGSTIADKNPDPWFFPRHIAFFGNGHSFNFKTSCLADIHARCAGGGTRFYDGIGDILGTRKETGGINTGNGRLDRPKGMCGGEGMAIEGYAETIRKLHGLLADLQAHGEDHHVKRFFVGDSILIGISDDVANQAIASLVRVLLSNVAADSSQIAFLFGVPASIPAR